MVKAARRFHSSASRYSDTRAGSRCAGAWLPCPPPVRVLVALPCRWHYSSPRIFW